MITQWHEYSDEEKAAWLIANVLDGALLPAVLDANLVQRCEQKLTAQQRALYVTYMNSDIARMTYAGKSDAECRTEATTEEFYWNYATASTDLRGRIIWNIVADFAP